MRMYRQQTIHTCRYSLSIVSLLNENEITFVCKVKYLSGMLINMCQTKRSGSQPKHSKSR